MDSQSAEEATQCNTCGWQTDVLWDTPWARDPGTGEYFRRKLCPDCWELWDAPAAAPTSTAGHGRGARPAGRKLSEAKWVAILLSLDSREDRRRRVSALLAGHEWLTEKLLWAKAIVGQGFASEKLVPSLLGNMHSDQAKRTEPRFAPLDGTGLTWNNDWLHMTPGAVGCALSHKAIWELVASSSSGSPLAEVGGLAGPLDWALVLEDDLLWAAADLKQRLEAVVAQLPADWDVCYVGWHCDEVLRLALRGGRAEPNSTPVVVERWRGHPEPMGTFGYMVSAQGAAKLLEHRVVFPMDYQLDKQLDFVYAAGSVRAFRCTATSCMFYSPPCQYVDSDVQTCWSADHTKAIRAHKEGFLWRLRELDALCRQAQPPSWPALVLRCRAAALAELENPRRCAAVPVSDPGSAKGRSALVSGLQALLHSLKHYEVSAVVVLFGRDPPFAEYLREAVVEVFPRGAVFFYGGFNVVAQAFGPGAPPHSAPSPASLAAFASLLPLLALCAEDIFLRMPDVVQGTVESGLGARLAAGGTAEVVVTAGSQTPDLQAAEEAAQAVFRKVRSDPHAAFVGREQAVLPPPFDPAAPVLFRGRSWAKMATWVREMLRIFLRLEWGAGRWDPGEGPTLAAQSQQLGGPLVWRGEASLDEHAGLAIRCALGLAGLSVVACVEGEEEWEPCD